MDKETSSRYSAILNEELVPAFGCTEPIAIAFCAAKAREVLGCIPDRVKIEVSGNIVKNVKSVIVPNTGGQKGIETAASAGIIAGNSEYQLEVIASVSEEQRKEIAEYRALADIRVLPFDEGEKLDIRITESKGNDTACVRVSSRHTNITYISRNEEVLLDHSCGKQEKETCCRTDRSHMDMESILDYAMHADLADAQHVLSRQIEYNKRIAEEGIAGDWGANIGSVILKSDCDCVKTRAKAMAAAGSDARMSGCELPVVINSGSGNQGMAVSIPVIVYAEELKADREQLYRALAISNLTAIHLKAGIGELSAFCGAVSAGCAAGCGIAYLKGGNEEAIAHTLVNSLAIVSGIICDGAKPSCAGKIAASVDAGILGYEMYQNGQQFYGEDGIVSKGVENTIRNICRLAARGMNTTDQEIIRIMTHCD